MKRLLCILGLVAVLGGCGEPALDDPATLDRNLEEAVVVGELQKRGPEGAKLYYLKNQQTVVMLGGGGGRIKGGQNLDYLGKADRQMCRLYLNMMDKMGVHLEEFGDAKKPLSEV